MTPESRLLVQQSWENVLPAADRAAEVFYRRLFSLDPQLARLFRGADMRERGRALARDLTAAVRALPDAPSGAGAAFLADDPRYAHLGCALLATLGEVLGARFTAAVAAAWVDAFGWLAPALRRAALPEAGDTRVVPIRRGRLVEIGS